MTCKAVHGLALPSQDHYALDNWAPAEWVTNISSWYCGLEKPTARFSDLVREYATPAGNIMTMTDASMYYTPAPKPLSQFIPGSVATSTVTHPGYFTSLGGSFHNTVTAMAVSAPVSGTVAAAALLFAWLL